ncbi:helix-turn-helix domain-containing protein [Leucobacter sp. W1478]|uniref:helix-turn-helix domain-containing protein n=1 Tax=Leucobacter sp. W1478 TaxID=3439065 RepID=UPI003F2EBF33
MVQLVVDYANGLTQMEIAKKHGIHVQTVRKRLRDAGVNTRSRVRLLRSEQLDAARSAIADGASLRATAQSLGVSHTTLQRNLKQKQG